jgi:predicted transcriptional regulator of viral defense system
MSDQLASRTRLFEIAEEQAGFFTAAQALGAGYSYESQTYHHKTGNWLREGWGIYRLALYPFTEGEEYVRLMLWSRSRAGEIQAVISHETALLEYELSNVLPGKIHLTVSKGFRKEPPEEAVLHYADLPDDAIRKQDGYRITTPLRTLLDVAASPLSPEHLQAATADALSSGLVRSSDLKAAVMAAPPAVRERYFRVGLG